MVHRPTLNAVKAASVILGTGGLIAVVDLFGPLMPENAQEIFVLVLILVMFVEFLTLVGVYMTGLAEGLPLGRHAVGTSISLRIAVIAMFAMVVALNFFKTSWLADELQPFLVLFLTWFGGWTLLRLHSHRRAIDALGASAVSDR
jgi:hypothetical protein